MTKNKTYSYHDQTNLARWIKRLAIPYFLGLLFVFALDCYKLPHLNSILAILPNPEFDYLAAEDVFDEQVGMFYLLLIPFIIVWLIETLLIVRWIYRAAANTYALNIPIYYKPHWSVTSYIIPIVNFIVPYRAMRQIAENSTQAARQIPFPNLLGYWWATWLIGGIVARVARSFAVTAEQEANIAHNAHDLLNAINIQIWANQMAILSVICHIACALLLLRIIRQINRAHAALHDANTSENAVAPVGVNNAVNFYTSTAK